MKRVILITCASGRYYNLINVFDRYDKLSIKSGIRNWRIRGALKRMNIQTKDVPLPHDWQGFRSVPENKAGLALFLSDEIIQRVPVDKFVVVGNGSLLGEDVKCNDSSVDITQLRCFHEEGDTRILIQC